MKTPLEQLIAGQRILDIIPIFQLNPDLFNDVLDLALNNKNALSWRGAWIVEKLMEDNDPRVQKQLNKLIHVLPDRADSDQREIMRILLRMEFTPDMEGLLFDHCASIWEQTGKPAAVRMYAIRLMKKISMHHPELKAEFSTYLQPEYLARLSPAMKRSIYKLEKL